mmetsp:Transcript_75664/g.149548  ORF Transcript_75664/g.149548 Transcript_75664/m.149548 type:complete len:202 (+) Transcript_75664:1659-2264(+)
MVSKLSADAVIEPYVLVGVLAHAYTFKDLGIVLPLLHVIWQDNLLQCIRVQIPAGRIGVAKTIEYARWFGGAAATRAVHIAPRPLAPIDCFRFLAISDAMFQIPRPASSAAIIIWKSLTGNAHEKCRPIVRHSPVSPICQHRGPMGIPDMVDTWATGVSLIRANQGWRLHTRCRIKRTERRTEQTDRSQHTRHEISRDCAR